MISEAELRRSAAAAGVDGMVLDLDYALGWFLAGLFSQPAAARHLVFKGGTCLRKCYFADYRFSEDLDFTLNGNWPPDELRAAIETVARWSAEADGPDFGAGLMRLEIVNDEYGRESYLVRVYYRGPLRWGGPPRAIQLDVNRDEWMAFPPATRPLLHLYSDAAQLAKTTIPCYTLAEMLAEKLRAISGQRRFAISRDLYDIYQLAGTGIAIDAIRAALPAKFAAKGLSVDSLSVERLVAQRDLFLRDWNRRLAHLLPAGQLAPFDSAWQATLDLITLLEASS